MKYFYFTLLSLYLLASLGCRPAAAPVSISNKPVSVNDVPTADAPVGPPLKPIEEMTWQKIDGATNADGSLNKLKDLRGKAVILDFWATYCPPCLEEIPHLKALQKKYGRDNLEIIGLHVGGEEDRPKIPSFVDKLKIDYTLATPEDELTRFIFGKESAIPQTAIFDRSGKLVLKIVGFSPQIQKELDAAVETAINSQS
jgi:thiol-disulfide isomerase/thioredoxin